MEQNDTNMKMIAGFLAGVLFAGGGVYLLTSKSQPAGQVKAAVTQESPVSLAVSEPVAQSVAHETHEPPVMAMKSTEPTRIKSMPIGHQQHSPVVEKRLMAKADETRMKSDSTPLAPISSTQQAAPAQTQPPPAPSYPQSSSQPPPVEVEHPRPVPKPREPAMVTIPAGTLVPVRLNEAISSEKKVTNDPFTAVLSEQLVVNGFVLAERGARAEGRLVDVTRAGKVKGVAHLALELTSFISSDGQRVKVQTAMYEKDGPSSVKKDVGKVAVGAGVGAILGGIFGGGKGAAIGAGAGGGAAEGGVLLTRGEPAVLPVETRISFRITDPVTLTEKLN